MSAKPEIRNPKFETRNKSEKTNEEIEKLGDFVAACEPFEL